MILTLYIIGTTAFVISVVAGLMSGSFVGFVISIAGGISSATILFAIAKILENQENILYKLIQQEEVIRKSFAPQEKKTCQKCGYKYKESDYSYCPHCAHRE